MKSTMGWARLLMVSACVNLWTGHSSKFTKLNTSADALPTCSGSLWSSECPFRCPDISLKACDGYYVETCEGFFMQCGHVATPVDGGTSCGMLGPRCTAAGGSGDACGDRCPSSGSGGGGV
eukprot:gb/GFBE01002514.1/.p1 GENE.gb/GFBE01002514.1/~~gb/GFBE01002514.1/.p1  ORF type:complete len:121 (+),score=8.37 gb/GFBE01002514.1/:1-363(+)